MLELKAVNPGSIRLLYIVMIIVVVELIHNADTEWTGVGEAAEINPSHIKVFTEREVTFGFQDRMNCQCCIS